MKVQGGSLDPLPVLIVEDNADDEALLCEAFRRARLAHPLVVARDGLEAIAKSIEASPSQRPALIVLDLALPYLSGFDVLSRLRSDPRSMLIPAVVLSSSGERADIVRAYEAGANSYLTKPLEFRALSELVRRVARYWLGHNEAPPRIAS